MARIPLRHKGDPEPDPAILATLEGIETSESPLLNAFRALANKPESLGGFMTFANSIYNTNSGSGYAPSEAAIVRYAR